MYANYTRVEDFHKVPLQITLFKMQKPKDVALPQCSHAHQHPKKAKFGG